MQWIDVVAAVKEVSIVEVARRLGIRFGRSFGGYQMCHCFMHDDREPSMWLTVGNNRWCCGACDKGGDVISLVMECRGVGFGEAVRWLAGEFGIEVEGGKAYAAPKSGKRGCSKRGSVGQNWGSLSGFCKSHVRSLPILTSFASSSVSSLPILTSAGTSSVSALPALATASSNPNMDLINKKTINMLDFKLTEVYASSGSPFCEALVGSGILTREQMLRAAKRYLLGGTKDGGVVFWQIDREQRLLDGKIMFYRPDCHRDHGRHPTWVVARMKGQRLLPQEYVAGRCLFGSHLVGDGCQVAVVESEKTAVIMSEYYPDFVWVATGGLSNLTVEMLEPLRGCKVILFPDTDPDGDAYGKWLEVAKVCGFPVYVSDVLEFYASLEQRERKIDVADFIVEGRQSSGER